MDDEELDNNFFESIDRVVEQHNAKKVCIDLHRLVLKTTF